VVWDLCLWWILPLYAVGEEVGSQVRTCGGELTGGAGKYYYSTRYAVLHVCISNAGRGDAGSEGWSSSLGIISSITLKAVVYIPHTTMVYDLFYTRARLTN
jgi:hypothetical protein